MSNTSPTPAILLLEDGTVHYGKAFGKRGTTSGEICFNTGMTGYQEVFTDPSYYGQVLIMNSVHIGNYGVKDSDVESAGVKIRGLIGRNLEEQFSRLTAKGSLDEYMKSNNIVCIEEVDTRALVAHVRVQGAMNCVISSETTDLGELKSVLATTPRMDGLELASAVSTDKEYELGDPGSPIRVAVLDYGVKKHILQCMVERGAFVKVFPAKTPLSRLQGIQTQRLFPFQRPGRPRANGLCNSDGQGDTKGEKAIVRHLPRTPASGPRQRHSNLQDASRPSGAQPSGKEPCYWAL